VGATSLIAEHCARIWVAQVARLTLAARNRDHLERIAADLRVRSPNAQIAIETLDFLDRSAIEQFAARCLEAAPVDIALIAHGTLPDQKSCEADLAQTHASIAVNAVSPALFAEAFAQRMASVGHGPIAVIGSPAGDRGRRPSDSYGPATGCVDRSLASMR